MADVYYYESIEQVQAIAEPTRWRILDLLVQRPMTGAQLARALDIPRTRAHYHLKVLEKVGLIMLGSEQINQGMVEKYYHAIAKEFRTDKLLDQSRLEASKDDALQASRTVRDLMLAMMDLARVDLSKPENIADLVRFGLQRQDEWYLTAEQANALRADLRELAEQYAVYDQQNRPHKDVSPFVYLRHTWLLTPVAPFSFEAETEPSNDA